MKLFPFEMSRELYGKSKVLADPRVPQSFAQVLARLRRFSRDSVLSLGSAILWHIWSHDSRAHDLNSIILRAYAPHLLSLAAFHCARRGRPDITEIDFRILCNEFHCMEDAINDESWINNEGIPKLWASLQLSSSQRLRNIGRVDVRFIIADISIARAARVQWEGIIYHKSDTFRQFMIYREFRALMTPEYRNSERNYLGTPLETFVRCIQVIFSLISDASTNGSADGYLDLNASNLGDVGQSLGLDLDDLKIVARRLSTPLSQLRALGQLAASFDPYSRRLLLPEWLNRRPLIELDEFDGKGTFGKMLAPSPWKLHTVAGRYLTHELMTSLNHDRTEEVYSLRGIAFENYLEKVLKPTSVRRLTDIPGYPGKRPDFCWSGSAFEVLIEAKITIKPNSDPESSSITSITESWRRADECLDQACEYLEFCSSDARFLAVTPVLIIVTNDSLSEEVSSCLIAAKRWNFIEGTGVVALLIVTPAEMEHFAFNWTADQLGEYAKRVWDGLDTSSPSNFFRDSGVTNEVRDAPPLAHIRNIWSELLPPLADQCPL